MSERQPALATTCTTLRAESVLLQLPLVAYRAPAATYRRGFAVIAGGCVALHQHLDDTSPVRKSYGKAPSVMPSQSCWLWSDVSVADLGEQGSCGPSSTQAKA